MDGCFIGDPRFFFWINKNGKKNLINLIMDKFLCESDQQNSDKVIHQCLNKIYIEYKKYKDECNRLKLKVDQLEAQLKCCSCHENTPSPPSSSSSSSAAAAAAAITPPIATDGSNSKKRKSPENSQQDVEELQPPPMVPFQSKLTSQPIDSNVILAPETEYDCFEQFNNAINDSEQFNETISETPEQLAKSNAKKLLSNNKKKCKSSSTTSTCSSASSSSSSSSSSLLSLSPMKLSSPGRSPLMQLSNNEQRKVNSNKQQQQQQQIQNTTIPGLLLSPDKYYDAAEFDDCLPKRQKNLNTSLKENTSMDKSLPTSSSTSFSSKWISKKSKLYNNISNDLNISFIQPIFPKKKNQIDMKLLNDDDGGGAGDGANPNGPKTQLNDTKRIKLKQATLSFQKKIDDIRQINDDSNATFCADITQPNFSNAVTVGTGGQHQKPLSYLNNNQQQPKQDKRIKENLFNFSKIKEKQLSNIRRPVEEDKKETIISSSNNNNNNNKNIDLDKIKIENIYNNSTNKITTNLSNITTNPVSPSIIEIKRNDTTDNNSSVILIEDTQPIFTIENDSDENSSDLIEKMNKNNNNIVNVKSKKNGNYCGETSPIRKKSEKLKRPGFLCNECSKYYNIMDLTYEEYMKRVNQCSNHRKPQHIKETPEGFWNPFITPATGNGADETNSSQSP